MSVQLLARLVGGGLIIFTGLTLGRLLAARLFSRIRVLEDLRAAIERLSTEVTYGASLLGDALLSVAESSGSECRSFLETVSRELSRGDGKPARIAWEQGVRSLDKAGVLTPADTEVLSLLGPSLGNSGRNEQHRHLAAAKDRLSVQVEHARREALRFDTFYREMGVLVAVAIVIILL